MKRWIYIVIAGTIIAAIIAWYYYTHIKFVDAEDEASEGIADTSGLTMNKNKYPHFTSSEFDSPDKPGSGQLMKETFMSMLENARVIAAIPFVIVSGYRTVEHNKSVGGATNSAHLRGYAADIKATTKEAQQKIVDAWLSAGGKRFGIGNTFVHVDSDPSLPQSVCWGYNSSGTTPNAWYNPNHFA